MVYLSYNAQTYKRERERDRNLGRERKFLSSLYIENMKSIQRDPALHVWTDASFCASSWHKIFAENTSGWPWQVDKKL